MLDSGNLCFRDRRDEISSNSFISTGRWRVEDLVNEDDFGFVEGCRGVC